MIPIRRYPYTDFHDLNLDFLLNQFSEYEAEIDDLKRRVKALEDWRIVIDGDIITIKGDIVTIKGDIVTINNTIDDHSRRLTTIEGDIVIINRTIDDHSIRIEDLEKQSFCFLMVLQGAMYGSSSTLTDYPYEYTIPFLQPSSCPEDYMKFYDGTWKTDSKSEVRLEFINPSDYETYGPKIASYIQTYDNNGIRIFTKEIIDKDISFYAYVMNKI